jgi:hypothetical protein
MSDESEAHPTPQPHTWTEEHTSFALVLHKHGDKLPTTELQRSAQKLVRKTMVQHKEVPTIAQLLVLTATSLPDSQLLQALVAESTRLEFETTRPVSKTQLKISNIVHSPNHLALFSTESPPQPSSPAPPAPQLNGHHRPRKIPSSSASKTKFKTKKEIQTRVIQLTAHLSTYIKSLKKPVQ